MLSELELRQELAKFLSGQSQLDDFEDWFVRESWNIHKSDELGAQQLVNAIELRLAEHDSGHIPDADLRSELKKLIDAPMLVFYFSNAPSVQTSGSLSIIAPNRPWALRFVDISPAKASGSQVHR